MNAIAEKLSEKKILVADGSWGWQLTVHGLPVGQLGETWNLENPAAVQAVAQGYVDAGADIILTNSFQGSTFKLASCGLEDQTEVVNRVAAELSLQAAAGQALVAASIGPTGEFMQPLGLVSEDEMVACFARQVAGFAEAGVDAILIETMTDLGEARAALQAVRDGFDGPAIVSMTFDKGPAGYATMMGVKPEQAAAELQEAGADIVGSNCGAGIVNIIEVIAQLSPATDLPVWAKPNAGMPELIKGETVFRETPEEMASHFEELVDAGASIIGGCCGTSPDHIAALVAERDRLVG